MANFVLLEKLFLHFAFRKEGLRHFYFLTLSRKNISLVLGRVLSLSWVLFLSVSVCVLRSAGSCKWFSFSQGKICTCKECCLFLTIGHTHTHTDRQFARKRVVESLAFFSFNRRKRNRENTNTTWPSKRLPCDPLKEQLALFSSSFNKGFSLLGVFA